MKSNNSSSTRGRIMGGKNIVMFAVAVASWGCHGGNAPGDQHSAVKQREDSGLLAMWQRYPMADWGFHTGDVRASTRAQALVAGWWGGGLGGDESSAAIYRWRSTGGLQRVHKGPGAVLALAEDDSGGWALARPSFGEYVLLHSNDGGASWRPRASVPTKSARGLVVADGSLWLYGSRDLLRSRDGGQSWDPISPPVDIGIRTRLAAQGGRLMVYGDTLVWTDDGGQHWTTDLMGERVSAIDGEWVSVMRNSSPIVARVRDGALEDGPAIPTTGEPVHLSVEGATIRVLSKPATTSPGEIYEGWIYLHSEDDGSTWRECRLWASIGKIHPPGALPSGAGFVVSRGGELLVFNR
ncbi:hypothetical protein [Nannocystis pusilla]|uniref:Photosynthesis system II assembly factor Ycf48/Hcf136-like domain-containing protein n=1 Tax=Nannocystis pusilla TaxID=889268 RepID=A0ABS7TV68_9BACT|nr:hypothetical protein [Nannocystis pusilla]MBZ5712101.1 hypothetical protein [Nannocystis pusilla]